MKAQYWTVRLQRFCESLFGVLPCNIDFTHQPSHPETNCTLKPCFIVSFFFLQIENAYHTTARVGGTHGIRTCCRHCEVEGPHVYILVRRGRAGGKVNAHCFANQIKVGLYTCTCTRTRTRTRTRARAHTHMCIHTSAHMHTHTHVCVPS